MGRASDLYKDLCPNDYENFASGRPDLTRHNYGKIGALKKKIEIE